MQDISYTSELTQAEDGRPLALDYYIVANDGEPGRYGVKIIEKNSGEQAMAFDLTTEAQRICELVDRLSQQIKTAETELHELTHGAEQARQDYAQLISWAGLYDKCTFEAKKMIAAQFIKTVHIKRDYEIEIEFNVAFTEFQKIYLEPEPEESKRRRSATTILALAETAGQAV